MTNNISRSALLGAKSILFALVWLASALLVRAGTLEDARTRWLKGNYEEARNLYEEAAKDPKQRDQAALGISKSWQSEGEYDKALQAIDDALKNNAKNAALHARRAELLHLRGRWDDATKAVDKALELDKDHFLARWIRARLAWDQGDTKTADNECRWFVKTYTQRSEKGNEVKDPDDLLLCGLAGCENARWHKLSDQFEFVVNDVYGDALKRDKNYWPAEQAVGMLFLEKYNRAEAQKSFNKVLTINPKAAEALVGKAMSALQRYEFKDAEQLLERALSINPRMTLALQGRADIHLFSGDIAGAVKDLEAARKVNPRDEQTLGRLAACALLQRKDKDYKALVAEAEKHDKLPGVFFFAIAEALEHKRRYTDAESYFKKAAELRPMLPWANASLGMLYMRLGREKEAQPLLQSAFDADRFNVRVANTLKVLRHLEKYQEIVTDHFILRFDEKHDAILARTMAEYCESIYTDLAKVFNYQPKDKILIELFNNHEMFSGRTVAVPDLHTIGACTGRVVTMVSPRDRSKVIRKPFNWVRVLRHELVHIFNLEQTNFQVPHWFTEGLAVSNEGFPRPQPWNQLLLDRVRSGKLLNLDTVDLGFIRPRSAAEWHLAYCQSQLYVDYIKSKHGPAAIGGLLDAYRDGLDTEGAIKKVCKVDKAAFEKGYKEFLAGVVKDLKGKPGLQSKTLNELRDLHDKEPDNLDISAELAEKFLLGRRKKDARALADKVLEKNEKHAVAAFVKAQLLLDVGEDDKALELLEGALDEKDPEPRLLALLGKRYFETEKFDKAAEMFEAARKIEPYESRWLLELARVYAQSGDVKKRLDVLRKLVPTDSDDLEQRRLLARLLLEQKLYEEAERYARQSLEIDVLDLKARALLGESLLHQKKTKQAVAILKEVVELHEQDRDPRKADQVRIQLAQAYLDAGQKDKAEVEITKVLVSDPDHAEAKAIRDKLKGK